MKPVFSSSPTGVESASERRRRTSRAIPPGAADGRGGAPELVVVAGTVRMTCAPHRGSRAGIGYVFRDHVDDPPQRIGPIENARGAADHLHPIGGARFDRRAVFVAPGVVFEAIAVT